MSVHPHRASAARRGARGQMELTGERLLVICLGSRYLQFRVNVIGERPGPLLLPLKPFCHLFLLLLFSLLFFLPFLECLWSASSHDRSYSFDRHRCTFDATQNVAALSNTVTEKAQPNVNLSKL